MTQANPSNLPSGRLPLPATVVSRLHWPYVIPITTVHLLALLAFIPWLFSWTGLVLMIIGVHVFGQGINLCYHRLLTHRSFKVPRWLEHVFTTIALCCMQDTPARWVANHRYHHRHSDTQPDPHSPLVNFLWSHVGWLMFKNHGTHHVSIYHKYAADVVSDPFYMRLEKQPMLLFWIYVAHAAVYFLIGMGVGYLMAGPGEPGAAMAALQMGSSFLVWGVIVRTVAVWHITWSVNSLSHLFGYRSHDTGEHSTNNWLVALLTVGEGWHNNHHHDPASASNQYRWWEFDITYYEIKLLELLGLATDVKPTREKRRHAALQRRAGRKQGDGNLSDQLIDAFATPGDAEPR